MTPITIDEFWAWFVTSEPQLAVLPVDDLVNSLHDKVVAYDGRLGVEVCVDTPIRELIITANCNPSAFQSARDLVASGPEVAKWSFRALKPPQGFAFETKHDGVKISADELSFISLLSKNHPNDLCIRVFVPKQLVNLKQTLYIVNVIVETGLGEELASRISYLEVAPPPSAETRTISIGQLPDFIQWHNRKYGR